MTANPNAVNKGIDSTLMERLNPVLSRLRFRRMMFRLVLCWLLTAIVGLLFWRWNSTAQSQLDFYVPFAWCAVAVVACLGTIAALYLAFRRPDFVEIEAVSRRLESRFPDLDSALVTAIEQQAGTRRPLNFLEQEVVRRAVYHGYQHNWGRLVPRWQLSLLPLTAGITLAALLFVVMALAWVPVPEFQANLHRFDDVAMKPFGEFELTIEPGDTEVERGTSLLVLARFNGEPPPGVILSYRTGSGEATDTAMTKSLDDPLFGGRISGIVEPTDYEVRYAGRVSDTFHVSVFEYPSLLQSDFELAFPAYTGKAPKQVLDSRRVSAVVGTKVTVRLHINKPLRSIELMPVKGQDASMVPIAFVPEGQDSLVWRSEFTLQQTIEGRLLLQDENGRVNKSPPLLSIQALEDQPPKVEVLSPSTDSQASAIEEVAMKARIWDDYGVPNAGLSYQIGDGETRELSLAQDVAARAEFTLEHILELEQERVAVDDLVTFWFWAEDRIGESAVRRQESDLFFIEIRPFEEIYRQAQGGGANDSAAGAGGSSQSAEQAMELAELQKEIMNATWRVIREESAAEATPQFRGNAEVLAESQQQAIDQVDPFVEQLQDPESRQLVERLKEQMNRAHELLETAASENDPERLTTALKSEQAAFQTLLRMRAREFDVQQQQRRQPPASGSSAQRQRQRQMQQLNLQEQEARYAQQRLAEPEAATNPEEREDRQVLNRLRELARRQNDLNERIKDLQSAMLEAETPESREEMEQRLKRLQDEQDQILREADELQQRMQTGENQQRLAESAEQLEQVRQNLQQSAEALDDREVSRAAAEGTRAERDLSELRDEFQKRISSQFAEQLRTMQNEIRELTQRQADISERFESLEAPRGSERSLSSPDRRGELEEMLSRSGSDVERIREQMKQTIEEAEALEPLLADRLYETYRESERDQPAEALESSLRSLERGLTGDAQINQARAAEAIDRMSEGITRAAEGILGDETEALRLANETLQTLSRQLDDEIQREAVEPDSPSDSTAKGASGEPNPAAEQDGSEDTKGSEASRPTGAANTRAPDGARAENRGRDAQTGDAAPQENRVNQPGGEESQREESQRGNAPQGESQRGNGRPGQPTSELPQGRRLTDSVEPGAETPQGGRLGGNPNSRRNPARAWAPITGDDFREWTDQLRDVEEMIMDPELRAEAARIRDRARSIRKELQRQSAEPNWDLVRMQVARPLSELRDRVMQELLRRDGQNLLVPLDREPVPPEYERAVEQYYERLGSGQ